MKHRKKFIDGRLDLLAALFYFRPDPETVDLTFFLEDVRRLLCENSKPILFQILEGRFVYGWTLEETGHVLNYSRDRIQQLERQALRKLRQVYRARRLIRCTPGLNINAQRWW